MDDQLQKLMKQLEDAISDSLSGSERVDHVVSSLHSSGYDVFILLEATRDAAHASPAGQSATVVPRDGQRSPPFLLNRSDQAFLKSMGIIVAAANSVDESGTGTS